MGGELRDGVGQHRPALPDDGPEEEARHVVGGGGQAWGEGGGWLWVASEGGERGLRRGRGQPNGGGG